MNRTPLLAARQVSYQFAAVPVAALDLIQAGSIAARDLATLAALLGFWRSGTSSWCSIATIAEQLAASEDSIRRSIRRLVTSGLVAHERIQGLDTDSPENRTGWRWRFLWMQAVAPQLGETRIAGAIKTPQPAQAQAATPANLHPPTPANLHPNVEVQESRKIDRANDSSPQEGQESPEQTVIGRAVAIALEANQAEFAAAIVKESKRQATAAARNPDAYLKAVEAVASRIPGTKRAKPITRPLAYLHRTFGDFLAAGVAPSAVYRPAPPPTSPPTWSELKRARQAAEPPADPPLPPEAVRDWFRSALRRGNRQTAPRVAD